MKDLIIVGAGGFGRDTVSLVQTINNHTAPTWNIKGFLDDDPHALDGVSCHYPILGSVRDWQPSPGEHYALGIARPQAKEAVVNALQAKGVSFVSLISPSCNIFDFVEIGQGCLLWGTTIGDNARIGNFVHAFGAVIGQQAVVGDFSTLTQGINIANAKIGRRVFVGSHAVILNDKKIGDDAVIGAGSVVVTNVKAGTTVFGNPAKRIER